MCRVNYVKDLEKGIAVLDRFQSLQVYRWCLFECLVLLHAAVISLTTVLVEGNGELIGGRVKSMATRNHTMKSSVISFKRV